MLGLGSSLVYDGSSSAARFGSFVNTKSLRFDGSNDFAKFPAANTFESVLSAGSGFTISAWMKYDIPASGQGSTGNSLLGQSVEFISGQLSQFSLGTIFGPGHSTASVRNTMQFQMIAGANIFFNTIVEDVDDYLTNGDWFHVVYTSSSSGGTRTGNIYINGVNRTSSDNSTADNFSSAGFQGLQMGANYQLGSRVHYTQGNLDEYSWYSTAVDQTRVTQIYNSGCPLDEETAASLVGYWRMEDSDDDSSSNSNSISRTGARFGTDTPC